MLDDIRNDVAREHDSPGISSPKRNEATAVRQKQGHRLSERDKHEMAEYVAANRSRSLWDKRGKLLRGWQAFAATVSMSCTFITGRLT